MDKPSWDNAPEWAKYLAMDEDGSWFWYQYQPIRPKLGSEEVKEDSEEFLQNWSTKSGKWVSCKRWDAISSLEKKPNG